MKALILSITFMVFTPLFIYGTPEIMTNSESNELPRLHLNPLTCSDDEKDLLPGQWINSYIIDDVIDYFIINNKKENSVVHIPSSVYQYYCADEDYTNIFQLILDSNVTEKDFILITINTAPLEGIHWVLGIIHLKYKKIIILDSLYGKTLNIDDHFNNLIVLTTICYDSTNFYHKKNLKINIDEWEMVYACDAMQQDNMYDCGLFICIHAYSFITDTNFFNPPSSLAGREWIFYNFIEFSKFKETQKDHPYFNRNIEYILTPKDIDTILIDQLQLRDERIIKYVISETPIQPLTIKVIENESYYRAKSLLKKIKHLIDVLILLFFKRYIQ
ncbi:uncharacterized protein LOC126905082 isoform X2 [Daktulosphaira vitifoliae]|uniref:uncharacterized protein LOC126905082 isoform X2 n=1 Tax=Daktulosphaira vitifoliae TaxID=58002 RepID=UPI0021AA15A3|nr:uncharacterized protein LOC126905082 isoform X2 [Daktulosphaira vitifoliae]